jgi:tetratricopeptide (TPR) repeat protein
MLETIHEYAREQLEASGEATALQWAHARYFLALAEEHEPDEAWLDRLDAEADNLRAVLDWASVQAAAGDEEAGELGLRLSAAIWPWWSAKGLYTEGRGYLAQALARPATPVRAAPPPGAADGEPGPTGRPAAPAARRSRAKALNCAGAFAWMQGDLAAARTLGEESLALRRDLGDRRGIAATLGSLVNVALDQGDFPAARAVMEECLGLRRELGDKPGTASSLQVLGYVAHQEGDYAAARALNEESLGLYRELGRTRGMSRPLNNLALVAIEQGEWPAARALVEESLSLSRELGDKRDIALSLTVLGLVAVEEGEYTTARAQCEESLGLYRELGDQRGSVYALLGLSATAVGAGQGARGAALLGAADGLRESIGAVMGRFVRSLYERIAAAARGLLGDDAYERAWQAGRALSLDESTAYALTQETAAGGYNKGA